MPAATPTARGTDGVEARASFAERLASLDAVVQNQDNREHNPARRQRLLPVPGRMAAAARRVRRCPAGHLPRRSQQSGGARIRTLQEEIGRVIRARVVNPKWIHGVKRHGYKGAFEDGRHRGLPVRLRCHHARGGRPLRTPW
ncbi:cobaltochelatase subunit CobN [Cupriavidus basilensis]